MGEPLTEEEQSALRPELGKSRRIARISRPDALYGATASAQTSERIDEAIMNPIDFAEIVDVNLTKSAGNMKRYRVQGFGEFTLKLMGKYNPSKFGEENKRSGNRKPISKCRIYCISKKMPRN